MSTIVISFFTIYNYKALKYCLGNKPFIKNFFWFWFIAQISIVSSICNFFGLTELLINYLYDNVNHHFVPFLCLLDFVLLTGTILEKITLLLLLGILLNSLGFRIFFIWIKYATYIVKKIKYQYRIVSFVFIRKLLFFTKKINLQFDRIAAMNLNS